MTDATVRRLLDALGRMGNDLELIESELMVSALRQQMRLSDWTHGRLSAIAAGLDDLRDAIEAGPRTPD